MMDRVFVVAEIGGTHCGDPQMAHDLVAACAAAGADAVKLQRRTLRSLYTRAFYDSPYNGEQSYGPTYGTHREALELDLDTLRDLRDHAHAREMQFGCTAFDEEALADLVGLDVDFVKVASGSLKDTPLIAAAFDTGRDVIVSTGGGTWEDVDRVDDLWEARYLSQTLTLLQCTASYPAKFTELDLAVIPAMKDRYLGVRVGASLHDNGIAMAVAAYVAGARVIEKHVTLDRSLPGTDHGFSLEPQGLTKMVRDLRRVEQAWGDGVKRTHGSELMPVMKMSRSVRVARDLPAWHVLTRDDLCLKSPGGGLPPYELDGLVGKTLARDLDAESLVDWADLRPRIRESVG